jgi:hypothetical protein
MSRLKPAALIGMLTIFVQKLAAARKNTVSGHWLWIG